MKYLVATCLIVVAAVLAAAELETLPDAASNIRFSTADWPCWRGAQGNGIAARDQSPPLKWSPTENILWKATMPGRGHGSPIVVGDQIIVATAEEDRDVQSVFCFDRQTGAKRWQAAVHQDGIVRKGHKKSTAASSTPACDGQRVFVNFLNNDAIYTTALDLSGKLLWQTKVSEFAIHQGFGSSPTLYGSYVFIATDSRGGGVIAALDRVSGKIVWQSSRPEKANYASATLLAAGGRDQLVVHGCDLVKSFEPLTGKKLWEIEGSTTECVASLVTDGDRIFISGGWPRKHVQAVLADGSGKSAWESNLQVYVPSMIATGGHLFAVQDSGVATCWKSDTGEEVWKERVGGTFTSSLVLVGDNLFATNEAGQTFVFKANPAKFELVGENKLGDEAYATPAICGSRVYMRVVENVAGNKQETLYCIGQK